MAESSLSIQLADLLKEVAAYLGYGADSNAWSVVQAAELDRYVQSGVRQFYYPPAIPGMESGHQWSFLNPASTLTTTASDGAQDLPDGLARVQGGFFYATSEHRPSIPQVSEASMMALLSRETAEAPPTACCVRYKAQVAGAGQRLEVLWWPIPNAAYVLTYSYEAYSGKLTTQNPYPLGGMRYAELLTESCLAVAEQRANDTKGPHAELFAALLVAAVSLDRKQGARNFGQMGAGELQGLQSERREESSSDVTYKGGHLVIPAYATVRGYRLEVPDRWEFLSVCQKELLQNGIGPDRWPAGYREMLDEFSGFRAAADVHDVDYCLGRTAVDRKAADRRFLVNCLWVIYADTGGVGNIIFRGEWKIASARVIMAWAMYRLLRLGGRQAFVVSTKLDLEVRGREAVTEYDDLYEGEV